MFDCGRASCFDLPQTKKPQRISLDRVFSGVSPMDQVTRLSKQIRTAKVRYTAAPIKGKKSPLIRRPGRAFWQLAPDGRTIERLYDPAKEPLLEE